MNLLRRGLVALVLLLVVAYAGIVGYMFVNQRALQYDATGDVTALTSTLLSGAEQVTIDTGDSVVNGWYQAPRAGMPLIVYYKGNSQSFSAEHERFEQFVADGYGFLAFDYRGFPASPETFPKPTFFKTLSRPSTLPQQRTLRS
ncbi:alpha/beta hydrolase family protein [Devosia aurantiaca]|uniref:Serine aminopeptidase S33 domain-containing protein n=1 Tax=Devosia aurantiaca TaxID=2714858 RepID=A0A6M1SYF5_9HYPH|nr:hypothetical protein [Devosia aurantiaca]NGP19333.1 hypothetical protein [Devosia aurantiaca]